MRGPPGIVRPPVDLGDKGGQGSCFHRGQTDAAALFCDVETKEARDILLLRKRKEGTIFGCIIYIYIYGYVCRMRGRVAR